MDQPTGARYPAHAVEFGLYVQDRRMALGMTQRALADAVGVTRPQVANIEAGRTHVPAYRALRIAQALGVTVEYLFGRFGRAEAAS